VGILLALLIYMATGLVGCSGSESAPDDLVIADSAGRPAMTVSVREMTAVEIFREVTVAGNTAPARAVDLRAETAGRVEAVVAARGAYVQAGQVIARITADGRHERLAEYRALLDQRRLEFDAAERLSERQLQSENARALAIANLRAAERLVADAEIDIGYLEIRTPFDGILQERTVEVGDYVSVGDHVARCIEIDPLVVRGEVSEANVRYVKVGEEGFAHLSTGEELAGHIRYVASEAHPQTRTFAVELEVANPAGRVPAGRVPAGLSADIRIETERVLAHKVSPALISIADDGRFGVKYVDDDNIVRFVPADIVRSSPDTLWLTGLPERVRLITIGQGFTNEGDRVAVQPEPATWN